MTDTQQIDREVAAEAYRSHGFDSAAKKIDRGEFTSAAQMVTVSSARLMRERMEETIREKVQIIADPDRRMCCNGHECGCMGVTMGQYAAWLMSSDTGELDALRYENERLREAAFGVVANSSCPFSTEADLENAINELNDVLRGVEAALKGGA